MHNNGTGRRLRAFVRRELGDPRAKLHWIFRLVLPLVVAVMLVTDWKLVLERKAFVVGEPSPETYFSVANMITYHDEETTDNGNWMGDQVDSVIVKRPNSSAYIQNRLDMLDSMPEYGFLPERLQRLLATYPEDARRKVVKAAASVGRAVIADSSTGNLNERLWAGVVGLDMATSDRNVIYQVLMAVFENTTAHDQNVTRIVRDVLRRSAVPMIREVPKNRVIVYKGETITEPIARMLRAEGFSERKMPLKKLLFIVIGVFLWSFWPTWIDKRSDEHHTPREWVFVALVLVITWSVQLSLAYDGTDVMTTFAMGAWFFLAFPPGVAFHLTLGGGFMGGLISFPATPSLLALQIMSSFVAGGLGYMFSANIGSRIKLFKKLMVFGAGMVTIVSFLRWGMGMSITAYVFSQYVLMSVLWTCIIPALLPLWESMFEIVSPLRLMEMSNPSHVLLKRLQLEAPGTYHHVLTVGTMAEAAAEKLGLSGLLVRAGAYYHDIGKLRRPRYFVENQNAGENVHDSLSPAISALVIISHVRDGIEIAEEYRLPKALLPFISEHHGTTCLTYFYKKAINKGETMPMEQFCYPGPRPRSKETGLVMLADSVEAAAKASPGRLDNPEDIRDMVSDVVASKLSSHQLEHVDFTLRELAVIKETFCSLLRSMHHSRKVKPIVKEVTSTPATSPLNPPPVPPRGQGAS